MSDAHLFRTPYAYATTMRLDPAGWWTLTVDTKYEGEPWSINDRRTYEKLSLAECLEVLASEVSVLRP
jgi:proline racemase